MVKQEIKNLESAYDHIMKASKSNVGQQQAAATSEAKAGGVLVWASPLWLQQRVDSEKVKGILYADQGVSIQAL